MGHGHGYAEDVKPAHSTLNILTTGSCNALGAGAGFVKIGQLTGAFTVAILSAHSATVTTSARRAPS